MINLSFQGEKGNQGEPGVAGKHVCNSLYADVANTNGMNSGYEFEQAPKTYVLIFDTQLTPHCLCNGNESILHNFF